MTPLTEDEIASIEARCAAATRRFQALDQLLHKIAEGKRAIAELRRLRAENAKLRADLVIAQGVSDPTRCESCGAPLFASDDYVTDPGGVDGCWHAMTDMPSKRERPCYAYRVGKRDARAELSPVVDHVAPDVSGKETRA